MKLSLDELDRRPDRAADLSPEERAAVILRCAALIAAASAPAIVPARRSEAGAASPYLGGDEAAAYTRMKKTRLDEWRRSGCVRAVRLGKEYGYRREDLDAFMARLAEAQAVPIRFLAFFLREPRRPSRRNGLMVNRQRGIGPSWRKGLQAEEAES